MGSISELYAPHHRRCDAAFADAEAAAAEGRWDAARAACGRFAALLEQHLGSEEGTLFPAFEKATGMTGGGPTFMMRHEHGQMRELLAALAAAVEAKSADDCAGAAETLLMLMQQHNMKEENMLYPMCDRALSDAQLVSTITGQLQA